MNDKVLVGAKSPHYGFLTLKFGHFQGRSGSIFRLPEKTAKIKYIKNGR